MKTIIAAGLLLVGTILSPAYSAEIKACSKKGLESLTDSINHQATKGYSNVKMLKNAKAEVVGFYAWDNTKTDMFMEICESLENEFGATVASEWFYWDSETATNPAAWSKGQTFRVIQDEGSADLKILDIKADGKINVELNVIGYDYDSDEVIVRSSRLVLE